MCCCYTPDFIIVWRCVIKDLRLDWGGDLGRVNLFKVRGFILPMQLWGINLLYYFKAIQCSWRGEFIYTLWIS